MLSLNPTTPPPSRAATALLPLPSCTSSPLQGSGLTGGSPGPPEQGLDAGLTFASGELSPARAGRGCPEEQEGAKATGGRSWPRMEGFCCGDRDTPAASPGGEELLFPRRGEEMAQPALQYRRVCAAGAGGKGGEGVTPCR